MTKESFLDPLLAADELLVHIVDEDNRAGEMQELAARIDSLMYALRFARTDSVAPVPQTDEEPTAEETEPLHQLIGSRFSMLGKYWVALYSKMANGEDAELAVGDAINDLIDIARELKKVRWYDTKHGTDEGLAALRWAYEVHLRMHLLPLRTHLEELIFEG